MKTPLVSLRRVSVSYDGHDALKEVDLDIYPDDFLGIIGPNGGGKTTLVKAIVGTIPTFMLETLTTVLRKQICNKLWKITGQSLQ